MQHSRHREVALRQQLGQVQAGQQQHAQDVQAQLQQQAQTAQAQFRQDVGLAFQNLAQTQQAVFQALQRDAKPERKMTLIDTKGLGKPEKYTGEEQGWLYWKTRVESFVTSVYPQMDAEKGTPSLNNIYDSGIPPIYIH